MNRRGTIFFEGGKMFFGCISFMPDKSIVRIPSVVFHHQTVSGHFCNNGGRGDRHRPRIPMNDTFPFVRGLNRDISVDQKEIRLYTEFAKGLFHGDPGRLKDIHLIDLFRRDRPYSNECRFEDHFKSTLPLPRRQPFGVVNPNRKSVFFQNDCRGDHRACQGSSPRLIDSADETIAAPFRPFFKIKKSTWRDSPLQPSLLREALERFLPLPLSFPRVSISSLLFDEGNTVWRVAPSPV